jgi:hypothetical protein
MLALCGDEMGADEVGRWSRRGKQPSYAWHRVALVKEKATDKAFMLDLETLAIDGTTRGLPLKLCMLVCL